MASAREFEAVRLPLLSLDVPHMQAILRQWDQARAHLLMPSERRAGPAAVPSARGTSALIDVLRDPLDFRYRTFDAGLVAGQGEDYTGRPVSAVKPPAYAAFLRQSYEEAIAERAPALHHFRVLVPAHECRYFRLLLPLSETGSDVDAIWAVTHYYGGAWQPPPR